MKNKLFLAFLFLSLSFSSFAFSAELGKVTLYNAQGAKVGQGYLRETIEGVSLNLKVWDLPPGKHGIHIHEKGLCETPDFKSAGGHFNPNHKKHGLQNPDGSHGGDLPNLEVNAQGKGKIDFLLRGLSLDKNQDNSLVKSDATALVVHADKDDELTDPSGNSGARIACGVIEKLHDPRKK